MLHLQEKKDADKEASLSLRGHIFMVGIEIPQGMEEGLSKKRRVPQQKEISKERRVCDIIGNKKRGT